MGRTLLCVSIMVQDAESALSTAIAARDAGADLIELRLDQVAAQDIADGSVRSIRALIGDVPLPCVVTCRPVREGGAYQGGDDVRIEFLRAVCQPDSFDECHPPAFVDIELSTIESNADCAKRLTTFVRAPGDDCDSRPRLIVSHHDYQGRPGKLFDRLHALRSVSSAAALKLAWAARSLRDNLEIFEILMEKDRPTIALVMGEQGVMSRVLAAKFGAFLTFATTSGGAATAPGQPTIRELLDLYHLRSMKRSTEVYGIVGWPVGHSLSPLVHNAGFEAIERDAVYVPMPIRPDWESFKATVLSMLEFTALDLRGLSVTAPHKQHLVRLATKDQTRFWHISSLVAHIGAANTLIVDDNGACELLNTDAMAIASIGTDFAQLHGRACSEIHVAIAGAGGAARAAAAALVGLGMHVTVCARNVERAVRLVEAVQAADSVQLGDRQRISAQPWDWMSTSLCEMYINATPIGMQGSQNPDATGIPLKDIAPRTNDTGGIAVFDMVYSPLCTPLLREAKRLGMIQIDGATMFVQQAAAQFRAWTGCKAPLGLFDRLVRETLTGVEA